MPEEIDARPAEELDRGGSPDSRGPGESPAPRPTSILNWRLVVWGALILLFSAVLSELTSMWWLVLLFGLAVPAVSALQARWAAEGQPSPRPQDRERELLGALDELGELAPTTAAMRTTLTVEEAAGMLEKLAKKGHLEARTQGAVVIYGLWEPDRRRPSEAPAPGYQNDRERSVGPRLPGRPG